MAHKLVFPDYDYKIVHALRTIKEQFGVVATLQYENFLKFGVCGDVDTGSNYTIMTLPGAETKETYVASDLITHVSSSNAGDTETLTVVGHTLSGNDFTRVSQTVVLAGQTKTALTTPLARVERMYNSSQAADLVGTIYCYEDVAETNGVPGTDTAIHCMIPAGENKSLKMSGTTSSIEFLLVSHMAASVGKQSAASVDFSLQIRVFPGVFTTEIRLSGGSTGSGAIGDQLDPLFILPPNTDYRMVANTSANNASASGYLNAYLAKNLE